MTWEPIRVPIELSVQVSKREKKIGFMTKGKFKHERTPVWIQSSAIFLILSQLKRKLVKKWINNEKQELWKIKNRFKQHQIVNSKYFITTKPKIYFF